MNIITKSKLWLAPTLCLVLASGCNTTETGFYIGDLDDVKLTTDLQTPEIRLAADGAPQEIEVLSNVKWELIAPEHPFSAVASSTEGNGFIKVSSTNNFNSSATPSSELTVRALDFPEKYFKVTLIQSQLLFEMDQTNYPSTPQQGGEVSIRFKSSINWTLDVQSGNAGWLRFNPGISGKGEWNDIKVTADWTPNYTTSERRISLQLAPSDSIWLENVASLLTPFTLVQEPGTLPSNVTLTSLGTDKTSASLTLSYESEAPVDRVELEVINQTSEQTKTFTVPKNTGETDYPSSGVLTFTLPDLDSGIPYLLTPAVISKVGETKGDPKRVQTVGDIEFKLPDLEECNIQPGITGVEAFFKTISEIELTSFEVSLCSSDETVLATQYGKITPVLDPSNTPISWIGELKWNNNVQLAQNTGYFFKVTVTGNNPNTPELTNTITHNLGNQHFTTLFRQPGQDDNHPIK